MRISVVGTGYVGLSTALGFCRHGHQVICADIDNSKIDKLSKGMPLFEEEGIGDAIKEALEKGLLSGTTDIQDSVLKTDITFICVGTPSLPDGKSDLSFLEKAASVVGSALQGKDSYHVVCIKSTVIPGTTMKAAQRIEIASGKSCGTGFGMCMNPEFLREGSALQDFLNPDRIVVGEFDKKSGDVLEKLYSDFNAPMIRTSLATAEMIKYASNAFLATKISFINDIGNLCKKIGIDVNEVARGMGYDKRISPFFLDAGCGYGGSCFPKDVSALQSLFARENVRSYVIDAVQKTNAEQKRKIVAMLASKMDLAGKKIAILGLSFKSNSDDVRDSVAIDVIRDLLRHNAHVFAYDPLASENMKKIFPAINYVSITQALENADACLILTACSEFSDLTDEDFSSMKGKIIIEGRRILDRALVSSFEGVCW